MEEPTVTELINKIQLLKQALLFYGDLNNYEKDQVQNDQGHQARYALQQLNKIEIYNQKMIDDTMKVINKIDSSVIDKDNLDNEFIDKINIINKIIEDYNVDNKNEFKS